MNGQLHAPAALLSEKEPRYLLARGWVDSRTGLDEVERRKFLTLPELDLRPLGHPVRNQSPTDCAIPYLCFANGILTKYKRNAHFSQFLHWMNVSSI
jgi:hypothetical protein